MQKPLRITGVDADELARALTTGLDHGGNPIEPFVDDDGGWPLRCCLRDSNPGDRIAIIAWSPFAWDGPYREVGPIVVHADGCPGADEASKVPESLERRAMVLRPYGHDRRIAYGEVRHVEADRSLTHELHQVLASPEIDFVHARNVTGGCWAFEARTNG